MVIGGGLAIISQAKQVKEGRGLVVGCLIDMSAQWPSNKTLAREGRSGGVGSLELSILKMTGIS